MLWAWPRCASSRASGWRQTPDTGLGCHGRSPVSIITRCSNCMLSVMGYRRRCAASTLKIARMKPKMALDEARDEEVAVVVAVLHPELERDLALAARRSQQIGLELDFQELVFGSLVD